MGKVYNSPCCTVRCNISENRKSRIYRESRFNILIIISYILKHLQRYYTGELYMYAFTIL